MSNNYHKLNDVLFASSESEGSYKEMATSSPSPCQRHLRNTIILVFLRTISNTLAPFSDGILEIQQYRYTLYIFNLSYLQPRQQNFLPKLKQHLFPRVLDALKEKCVSSLDTDNSNPSCHNRFSAESLLFQNDRLYLHHLVRINFTAYDVRRGQDVVNSSTTQCNIMVLANSEASISDTALFNYQCENRLLKMIYPGFHAHFSPSFVTSNQS